MKTGPAETRRLEDWDRVVRGVGGWGGGLREGAGTGRKKRINVFKSSIKRTHDVPNQV